MVFYLSIQFALDLKLYYLNDGNDNFNSKIVKYECPDISTYFKNNSVISISNEKHILDLFENQFPNEYDSLKILNYNSNHSFNIVNNIIPNLFCLVILNKSKITITDNNSQNNCDQLELDVDHGQLLFFEKFENFQITFNNDVTILMIYKKLRFKLKLKH